MRRHRMRGIGISLAAACLTASFLSVGLSSQPAADQSPERYERMATAEFSKREEEAAKKGEPWPHNPLLVALKFVGEDAECSSRTIVIRRPEGGGPATVEVTDDGLWDDSIRSYKFKLRLVRGTGGTWQITEALRAWSCWRGHTDYSTELCI
jgi:hypothetical protein